jgi:hypothetical protein
MEVRFHTLKKSTETRLKLVFMQHKQRWGIRINNLLQNHFVGGFLKASNAETLAEIIHADRLASRYFPVFFHCVTLILLP